MYFSLYHHIIYFHVFIRTYFLYFLFKVVACGFGLIDWNDSFLFENEELRKRCEELEMIIINESPKDQEIGELKDCARTSK